MATINTVVRELVEWVRAQQLTPQPREVVSTSALPPAALPHVSVVAVAEQQAGRHGSFYATLAVTVAHAAGRPAEAQATARDLAHQLRRALNGSHGLGGVVKSLRTAGIRHAAELQSAGEPRVVARSELLVVVAYDDAVI